MTVAEALAKARKKYPSLSLGRLIYSAVILSHPELRPKRVRKENPTAENAAKVMATIYDMTDKELEKMLNDIPKNIDKVRRAVYRKPKRRVSSQLTGRSQHK